MITLLTVANIVLLVVFGLSLWIILWYRKVRKFDHLPTPNYLLPVFGHALRVPKDASKLLDFKTKMFEETKSKLQVLWISSLPLVRFYDVNIIESLLKSNTLLSKGATYRFITDWLGEGLVTSDGDKWKSRRRLLTPAFHFGILKSNVSIINHHASCLVKHIRNKIKEEPEQEMQSLFKKVTLAIICETAMGVRLSFSQNDEKKSEYMAAVNDIVHLFSSRIYKPWLHNNFIYKYFSSEGKRYHKAVDTANDFVKEVLESRIKLLENNTSSNEMSIFLDILIDAYKKNEIDSDGILEEINTFMFAGHDTISSALGWTLGRLGLNESIQEKIYDEIRIHDHENLNKDMISQFKYLDCVIKESLRMHTPVVGVGRYTKANVSLADYKIPSGTTLIPDFFLLHRDPHIWKNPSEFIPERFMNYDSEKKNPYAFVPFSAGPRNCIGQKFAMLELKLVLFHLVKNFTFQALQNEKELEIYTGAILRAKNGIWLKISER